MTEKMALHTAARRYCQERFSEWAQVYEGLQRNEHWQVDNLFKPEWDYSDEAYRTFPRYRFAKSTQIEIERLTEDSRMSLAEMRRFLIAASERAHARLQIELTNKLAHEAMREEMEDFKIYVEAMAPTDLVHVKPLPYRRVLGREESELHWGEIRKAWGVGNGFWFPFKESPMPPSVLAFHTDYFENIHGQEILRDALGRRGVSRVRLLHEFGDPEYEIELGIFEPGYGDGGEQYAISQQADWIVYASHESSITLGGEWLISVFRSLHPECIELTYKGPYSTFDLRGTWETS